jgi:hypothetical protein
VRRVVGSLLVALVAASTTFVALLPTTAAPATSASEATYSADVSRVFYDAAGTATTVDERHVSLTVSATTNLRGRQQLDVSWAGAHPTGGVAADPNAGDAARQEYPFVLLQCRGTGATVTPETCWTATAPERYQRSSPTSFAWPAWRADALADADQRAQFVGTPDPLPQDCTAVAIGSERWVPFRGVKDTYSGGDGGCGGMAPESQAVSDVGLPSNTTYGVTGADGRGSARFSVWTDEENASLGCSASVTCSLVAVPVEGLSCDAWGTRLPADAPKATGTAATRSDTACRGTDVYPQGNGNNAQVPGAYNLSTSGLLWWSASNWDNRIVVPLSFAVSSSICGVVSKEAPLSLFGSILFNEVAAQWTPRFCTTRSLDPIVQVQAADSAARNLVQAGTASVALSTFGQDGGYGRAVVQAPVAMSGFAIAFSIDDGSGHRLTDLKLDARLVAKLLTESYTGNNKVARAYASLAGNPLNITQDPEFRALNPDVPDVGVVEAASTLITLNTDSDMMQALTSWIDADPEARAFLDGDPDPWGMQVNRRYQGIDLPVSSWTLLDTFQLASDNPCYDNSPAPYLGLIASPVGQLSNLIQDVQYAIPSATIVCSADADPTLPSTLKLRQQSRQVPGDRFVLGLVPLTAVSRYGLDAAELQTTSSAPLDERFTDASGRTFVAPGHDGLKAGAALLEADADQGLWTMPYDELHTAAGARAYPGTMPVFATVPTSGLDEDTARRAAQLLDYAAGAGQTSGIAVGQLPAGALPLTEANGLGAFSAYTSCAAKAVAAQRGDAPVVGASTCRLSAATGSPSSTPSSTTTPTSSVTPVTVPPAVTVPVAAVPSASVPVASAPATTPATVTSEEMLTVAASTRLGRLGLPVAGFLVVLLGVFGAGLRWGEAAAAGAGRLASAGAARWRASGKRVRR